MEEIKICETCRWNCNTGCLTCHNCVCCGNGTADNWTPKKAPKILDSGERTEYGTGAVRDCKTGKGRCDLIPLGVLCGILDNNNVIYYISRFKETGLKENLFKSIDMFLGELFSEPRHINQYDFMLEVSKHFEEGALKYGENNWQKGIPVHSYIDSAVRHYLKYRAGWDDEPHDRAFVWNLMCCIWTMEHHPEMNDFTEGGKNG